MCGRFILTVTGQVVANLFALDQVPEIEPRYNIAPTQEVPIVRLSEGARRCEPARWGLVPHWAKDPAIGNRMINARAETVAEKPSFRNAFRKQRCLVPADGFYEWKREGGSKQPYLIRFADGRPFAIAGLWESWSRPDAPPLETFTLITTEPNQVVAPLHNRMPVIVPPDSFPVWLDSAISDPARLGELLGPHPPEGMTAHPVSRAVNNPRNNGPECVER